MTKKVYRSAMGKTVDMGALLLQNETVRAVGNMNVNARGDMLDNRNRVIDPKAQQLRRQYAKQTNVSVQPATTGTKSARREVPAVPEDTFADLPDDNDVVAEDIVETEPTATAEPAGGLAAAIAKSRAVKQELEKTPRQLAKQAPIKKI